MSDFSILLTRAFTWHPTWFIFRKGYRCHFYFLFDQSHNWLIPFDWSHGLLERLWCCWRVTSSSSSVATAQIDVSFSDRLLEDRVWHVTTALPHFSLFSCHFYFLPFFPRVGGGGFSSHLLHRTILSIRTEAINFHNSSTTGVTLNWRIPFAVRFRILLWPPGGLIASSVNSRNAQSQN